MLITRELVLRTMKEAAEDFGPNWLDHHDLNALSYTDGTHDIAGETLRRLGVDLPGLSHRLNRRKLHTVALEMFWSIDVDALDVLEEARRLNDEGVRWSVIVANLAGGRVAV